MAHKPDRGESTGANNDGSNGILRNDGSHSRRGYLKLLGSSAAAAAALGTSASAVSAAEYDTVTLGEGESRLFTLDSGDALENLLIDATAPGADARIRARGDNWRIRNVGFRGSFDTGNGDGGYSNIVNVMGNGVIENVYMGDGVVEGTRKGAIGVPAQHAGHIHVENVHIAHWSANAVYAAGPARINEPGQTDGGGGSLTFRNSYFCNNNIAHLRIASDGTTVEGCVFHNTNDVPGTPKRDGAVNSRGIYTGYGDPSQTVLVTDSDFRITDENTNGGASALVSGTHGTYGELSIIRAVDSRIEGRIIGPNTETENVGSDPDVSMPDPAPADAVEAASGGETSGNGNSGPTRTIELSGGSSSSAVEYTFTVSDALYRGQQADQWDTVSGTTAEGAVGGGGDSYLFVGEITEFDATGELTVTIDGETVDPAQLGSSDDSSDDGDPELSNRIEISGADSADIIEYTFTVSDGLAPGPATDFEDAVSDLTASGAVGGGSDNYDFAGEVTAFESSGQVSVTINGETVDPAQLGSNDDSSGEDGSDGSDDGSDGSDDGSGDTGSQEKLLRIDGTADSSDTARYMFSVSGSVTRDQERSTVDTGGLPWDSLSDEVYDSRAVGIVGNGVDAYRFTGELLNIDIRGEASFSVDEL